MVCVRSRMLTVEAEELQVCQRLHIWAELHYLQGPLVSKDKVECLGDEQSEIKVLHPPGWGFCGRLVRQGRKRSGKTYDAMAVNEAGTVTSLILGWY